MSGADQPLLPQNRAGKGGCCSDPSNNPTGAIVAAIVATLGSFMFGFNLGFTSPALPSLEWGSDAVFTDCTEWNVGNDGGYTCKESVQGAFWSAIINFGAMAGAFTGGPVADAVGRKYAVILSGIPLAIGWLWLAFDTVYLNLLVARFLTGFGMGMVTPSINVFIPEISPKSLRGTLGSMFQLNLTIGILVVYVLGDYLTTPVTVTPSMNPTNPKNYKTALDHAECNWRLLAMVGCGVSVLMMVGMLFFPESPEYLISMAQKCEDEEKKSALEDRAIYALHFYRGAGYDARKELEADVKNSGDQKRNDQEMNAVAGDRDSSARPCCERGVVVPMMIMLVLHAVQQFSGINAVIFFCQEIFTDAGVEDPVVASLVVAIVQVVFTVITTGTIDMAGRRVLLTISLAGMAASCVGMSAAFHYKEIGERKDWLAVSSLLGYISFFSLGAGAIVWVLMGELLPLRARGIGSSIASGFNWSCSFLVTFFFSMMLTRLQGIGTFMVYAGVCAFGALFVLLAVPETKGLDLTAIEGLFAPAEKED